MQYHNFTLYKTVDIIISSLNFEDYGKKYQADLE